MPPQRLQTSSTTSQSEQAMDDLVYETHGSPDFSTYSLPSSPPSFAFRGEFEFCDALNFPVDSAQPPKQNDFCGTSLPIFYTGHDEHSSMFGEYILNEQTLEDRIFNLTYQLPDSLSTIDELSNPDPIDESVLDFVSEDWLEDFEDNEQTNLQDKEADTGCLEKNRSGNTTSLIFMSSPSIEVVSDNGTTPQDHSLNNTRTPHGQDPPDTQHEPILPSCAQDIIQDTDSRDESLIPLVEVMALIEHIRRLFTPPQVTPHEENCEVADQARDDPTRNHSGPKISVLSSKIRKLLFQDNGLIEVVRKLCFENLALRKRLDAIELANPEVAAILPTQDLTSEIDCAKRRVDTIVDGLLHTLPASGDWTDSSSPIDFISHSSSSVDCASTETTPANPTVLANNVSSTSSVLESSAFITADGRSIMFGSAESSLDVEIPDLSLESDISINRGDVQHMEEPRSPRATHYTSTKSASEQHNPTSLNPTLLQVPVLGCEVAKCATVPDVMMNDVSDMVALQTSPRSLESTSSSGVPDEDIRTSATPLTPHDHIGFPRKDRQTSHDLPISPPASSDGCSGYDAWAEDLCQPFSCSSVAGEQHETNDDTSIFVSSRAGPQTKRLRARISEPRLDQSSRSLEDSVSTRVTKHRTARLKSRQNNSLRDDSSNESFSDRTNSVLQTSDSPKQLNCDATTTSTTTSTDGVTQARDPRFSGGPVKAARTPHPYETKYRLKPEEMQVIINSAENPELLREDLPMFISENYRSWCEYGVWFREQSQSPVPVSDSDLSHSALLRRVVRWISIDKQNVVDAAIVLFRSFITYHGMLEDYEGLIRRWRESGRIGRSQTAPSEAKREIVTCRMKGRRFDSQEKYDRAYDLEHDYLTRTLKRAVNLKKITDGLVLGILIVGGPWLLTVTNGVTKRSVMTHRMIDCFVDYIKTSQDPRLARVCKVNEILGSTVENIVRKADLPSWEQFYPTLKEVEDIWNVSNDQPSDIDIEGTKTAICGLEELDPLHDPTPFARNVIPEPSEGVMDMRKSELPSSSVKLYPTPRRTPKHVVHKTRHTRTSAQSRGMVVASSESPTSTPCPSDRAPNTVDGDNTAMPSQSTPCPVNPDGGTCTKRKHSENRGPSISTKRLRAGQPSTSYFLPADAPKEGDKTSKQPVSNVRGNGRGHNLRPRR